MPKQNKPLHPLRPSVQILATLGSIAIHCEELFSPSGHQFDRKAIASLLQDAELRAWLLQMDSLSLVPKKRMQNENKI